MIPEYYVLAGSVLALLYLAYALHQRNKIAIANRDDWQDLNTMMRNLYDDNDGLKADLHRASKHIALLQSVNNNLKASVEDMHHHKTELMDQMSKLQRALDGMEQELCYINTPSTRPEPTPDELDEWYESQAKPEEDKQATPPVPPHIDMFNTIRDMFDPSKNGPKS